MATPVEWTDCSLEGLSSVTTSFATALLPESGYRVLRVAADGFAGNHDGGSFDLLAAMVVAGLEAWRPCALVLDFAKLRYEWGDHMQNVFAAPQGWFVGHKSAFDLLAIFGECPATSELPVVVVVSDLNREGLTSLFADEMGGRGPPVCDSVDEALRHLNAQLRKAEF